MSCACPCALWCVVCGVWCVVCGVWCVLLWLVSHGCVCVSTYCVWCVCRFSSPMTHTHTHVLAYDTHTHVGLARLSQAQRTTAWWTTNGSAPRTVTSASSRHAFPLPAMPSRHFIPAPPPTPHPKSKQPAYTHKRRREKDSVNWSGRGLGLLSFMCASVLVILTTLSRPLKP